MLCQLSYQTKDKITYICQLNLYLVTTCEYTIQRGDSRLLPTNVLTRALFSFFASLLGFCTLEHRPRLLSTYKQLFSQCYQSEFATLSACLHFSRLSKFSDLLLLYVHRPYREFHPP